MNTKKQLKTKNGYRSGKIPRFILNAMNNPILIGLAFSTWAIPLYFYVVRLSSFFSDQDQQMFMNFIEWFGTPYGLILAFVLIKVWSDFESVDRGFDREAAAFSKLLDAVRLINNRKLTPKNNRATERIIEKISIYTKHTMQHYGNEFSEQHLRLLGDKILTEIKILIGDVTYKGKQDSLFSELNYQLNEAIDARGERLSLSNQRLPASLWFLLMISSFIWLLPFFTLVFSNSYTGIFLIGGVTFVTISILVIINDLNEPFNGSWSINLESWLALQESIETYSVRHSSKTIKEQISSNPL